MPLPNPPRFDLQAVERANDEWGANCGPVALAAILDLTLDEVRPHMGDFERKHYTNPTLMLAALRSLKAEFCCLRRTEGAVWDWPHYGLCRVQWEGPWTAPGVPQRVRYRHTHWIGVCTADLNRPDPVGIFDINCLNNGLGWVSLIDWQATLVPSLLEHCEPKANGKWHLTHVIEIDQRRAA